MDRPIIFSAAMVRALLDGRKTQTRRLATSPLRKCAAGDRLYVREVWRPIHSGDPARGAEYRADKPENWRDQTKWRPQRFMPRWASRLTLVVEAVRIEPLQAISEADCLAEGPKIKGYAEFGKAIGSGPSSLDGVMVHTDMEHVYATPRCWYRELWGSLHTKPGERWDDNPEAVAISFRVIRGNIDAQNPKDSAS